jgi:xeroderma pigmentosum group C-complementing protein
LRKKLYEKYKKPAAEQNKDDEDRPMLNKSISQVLSNSKYKKKKEITQKNANPSSDSESSGDDYMVDPNNLDLNSDFFKPQTEQIEVEKPPNFDCNVGVALSDSESESEEHNADNKKSEHQKSTNQLQSINAASSSKVDFRKMHAFAKQLEHDKEQLLNYKSNTSQENVNILDLLAMGEPSWQQAPITANEVVAKKMHSDKLNKKKKRKESESDWEDVHGKSSWKRC